MLAGRLRVGREGDAHCNAVCLDLHGKRLSEAAQSELDARGYEKSMMTVAVAAVQQKQCHNEITQMGRYGHTMTGGQSMKAMITAKPYALTSMASASAKRVGPTSDYQCHLCCAVASTAIDAHASPH